MSLLHFFLSWRKEVETGHPFNAQCDTLPLEDIGLNLKMVDFE